MGLDSAPLPPLDSASCSTITSIEVKTFQPELMIECLKETMETHQKVLTAMTKRFNILFSDEQNEKTLKLQDDIKRLGVDSASVYNTFDTLNKSAKFYIDQNANVFRCYNETKNAPAQDDPRWLVMRNGGIGASEAEMVNAKPGINKTRWIKEKAGILARSFTGNWVTDQGHQMEPVVGKILNHRFNTYLLESTSLEHPKYPFIRASLDRYGWINGMPYIIEIKSPVTRVPRNGFVPAGYDAQMYQQHEVSYIENGLFADSQFSLFDTYSELMKSFHENDELSEKYYGAIVKYPHSKRAFVYSPISIKKRVKHWVAEVTDKLVAQGYKIANPREFWEPEKKEYANIVKIVYWKLLRLVLVPHTRNYNWVSENLKKYQTLWSEVKKYKNGYRDENDIEREALKISNIFSDIDDDSSEKSNDSTGGDFNLFNKPKQQNIKIIKIPPPINTIPTYINATPTPSSPPVVTYQPIKKRHPF
jgi:hypothetical protein